MSRREKVLKYFNQNKTEWEKQVSDGIEKYRKNDAIIQFKGDAEKIKNVTVKIRQLNHTFKFGANIFMLDEFETFEKNEIYREKFAKLFNLATLPFFWSDLEPEKGKVRYDKDSPKIYRRPAIDLCIDYCKEHHIEPKCHCLNYDLFTPKWLNGASTSEIKELLEQRFASISNRYSELIPSFEVTNETLQTADNQSAFFIEDDFVEWSFKKANKYFPNNHLIINDYNIWVPNLFNNRNYYYMQIERLLKNKDIRLDSIGMQFHSFFRIEDEERIANERYNPQTLYKLMNCYAKLGLKEQITEMTIPAYSNESEDEEIQADLIENVYKVFFSHPNMEAIIYWNLVDGYAAFAPYGDMSAGENRFYGGLLRFDMSEKAAYKRLYHLINDEWHTELVATPKNNSICFRGFLGEYEAIITVGNFKKTIKFDLTEKENTVVVEL